MADSNSASGSGVSLHEKVRFLSSRAAYGTAARRVSVTETHMAFVFLAGNEAYKLKKPVKYPFLDFSTLAAREADCREEFHLNRRLAPGVYLGVVPLTLEPGEGLKLGGEGRVVDWLVRMRRLPGACMLDQAIANHTVRQSQIEGVAGLLARFYRDAVPSPVSPEDYLSTFSTEHEKNREMLTGEGFDLPVAGVDTVLGAIDTVLADEPELLTRRVEAGRVVDGHGDLRPEHVCLTDPPVIIDCLEFNRRFRLIDPFDEISFLGMECEHLGAAWISGVLIRHCGELLEDRPPNRLLAFFKAYRACLRARLALAHLTEPEPREPEKWLPLARAYLCLAERAVLMFRIPEAGV